MLSYLCFSTLAKSKADPYVRLPSACMIEFTMLRLLGAAKLLQKTAEICTTAFQYPFCYISISINYLIVQTLYSNAQFYVESD